MRAPTSRLRGLSALLIASLLVVGVACDPPPPSCKPTKTKKCPAVPTTTSPPRLPPWRKTAVFAGLGAWADVYDWSPTYDPTPAFTLDSVDRLADAGVQTLYIQSGKAQRPEEIVDPVVFDAMVKRAHGRGMKIVSWYLPAFIDLKTDIQRLVAPLKYGVDGVAMDIESTDNKDLAARNAGLKLEALFTRWVLPDLAMAAIVLPPVVTDVLNLNYWPDFPWSSLAPLFDAWMPMGYWTNRTTASGYRDGEKYTSDNIDRLRAHLGDANAPVHPVGGIANAVTTDEVNGFVASAQSRNVIGGSLYDDTTGPTLYPLLQPLRR